MSRELVRDALTIWAAGLAAGMRMLRRDPVLGAKRLILPCSYWRTAEFGFVLSSLQCPPGARVLDLGSPKDLGCLLARTRGLEVVTSDILRHEVEAANRAARALEISGEGPGRVHAEVQDGRSLSFPDASFDAAFSVSVLEHIPDNGDTVAISELYRVVRPGGRIVVTVPFDRQYRETFVDGPVYERDRIQGAPQFYERHYDEATLLQRLIRATPARLATLEIWGEGWLRGERLLARLGRCRTAFSPLEPPLAILALRPVGANSRRHPMAAFVAFEKPSA